jgi:hypothetical protein
MTEAGATVGAENEALLLGSSPQAVSAAHVSTKVARSMSLGL